MWTGSGFYADDKRDTTVKAHAMIVEEIVRK